MTQNTVLRVGVVGTGSAAQIIHLPTLALLSDLYIVTALCDASRDSLKHCGEKFNVPVDKRYINSADLVKDAEVDIVVVSCSDEFHAEVAILAANAGKNVLIEKPMALTKEDGDAIIAARDKNKVLVAVGYMRRYAPAFLEGCKMVKSMKKIHYARVRDIIGRNEMFTSQSATFPKIFNDFPPEAQSAIKGRAQQIATLTLGGLLGADRVSNNKLVRLHRFLGGLSSHDLSAMREMLGMPKDVIGASWNAESQFLSVIFNYGDFCVNFETGIDSVGIFDSHLEVYGDQKRVKVVYDTPFVKGLPTTLVVSECNEEGFHTDHTVRPTYEDNFTIEYKELHKIFTAGAPLKLTPEDAVQDMVIFDMIVNAVARSKA